MPSKADAPAQRTSESGRLTRPERAARGEDARTVAPLESHAEFNPPAENRDPVGLLESQVVTRVPELVPIRYGRMATSPFAFYRGAALVMAADLSAHALAGPARPDLRRRAPGELRGVRLPGAASRCSTSTTSTRRCPGPFEWDVKRLAASLEIAGREQRVQAPRSAAIDRAGCGAELPGADARRSRSRPTWTSGTRGSTSSRRCETCASPAAARAVPAAPRQRSPRRAPATA